MSSMWQKHSNTTINMYKRLQDKYNDTSVTFYEKNHKTTIHTWCGYFSGVLRLANLPKVPIRRIKMREFLENTERLATLQEATTTGKLVQQ